MAEFASLDGQNQSIPTSGASTDRLQLTTPNSMITGTMAGQQYLGGPNIFVDSVNSRIGVQQGSTPQVLMGKHPTFGEGFFVSKNGVNVVANTDPSQFIFNSSQDVFKIVQSGTLPNISVSLNTAGANYGSNSTVATVAHGLNYVPQIISYISTNSGFSPLPYSSVVITSTTSFFQIYLNVFVDSVNITTQLSCLGYNISTSYSPSSTTPAFKYYLLQETAN